MLAILYPLHKVPAKVNENITLRVLDTGKEFLTLTGWAGFASASFCAQSALVTRVEMTLLCKKGAAFHLFRRRRGSSGSFAFASYTHYPDRRDGEANSIFRALAARFPTHAHRLGCQLLVHVSIPKANLPVSAGNRT